MFCHLLSIYSPAENVALLKRCRRALKPGGKIVIWGGISRDDGTGPEAAAAAASSGDFEAANRAVVERRRLTGAMSFTDRAATADEGLATAAFNAGTNAAAAGRAESVDRTAGVG